MSDIGGLTWNPGEWPYAGRDEVHGPPVPAGPGGRRLHPQSQRRLPREFLTPTMRADLVVSCRVARNCIAR